MTALSNNQTNDFLNALQLCLNNKIELSPHDPRILLFADKINPLDPAIQYFNKLIPGEWDSSHKNRYFLLNEPSFEDTVLIKFLLLTRLNEANMRKLAELNPAYLPLLKRLELALSPEIASVKQTSEFIFSVVQSRGMTLRELSERSGLTQVSISKFKAGQDMKLSNILKLANALGLKLSLSSAVS